MKTVKLHDKNFDIYINEQQIKLRVDQMATEIFQSLNGKVPLFYCSIKRLVYICIRLASCLSR